MEKYKAVFLDAVGLALKGGQMTDDPGLSAAEWVALLRLAAEQEVLPLTYESIMSCPGFTAVDKEQRIKYRDAAVALSARQIVQNNEFLTLMLHIKEKGFEPAVLKGIAVRRLYPKPMLRPSIDEDLLCAPKDAKAIHELLIEEGLTPDSDYGSVEGIDDLSYHRIGSPTYIELHTSVFPSGSEAYGDLNSLFDGVWDRMEEIQEEDVKLKTLSPEDHLLFLMLHAYKHFLHSGMGLRHVCDICLFAVAHNVDGRRIRRICDEKGLSRLFAAVFAIGSGYLGLEAYPAFDDIDEDPEPLLEDMLSGGLYGTADIDRAHSSTLTLEAAASQKSGRKRRGALSTVFPPAKTLEGGFPVLKKHPLLLPFIWVRRLWEYITDRKNGPVDPSKSLKIARERIALMERYGLLDKGSNRR